MVNSENKNLINDVLGITLLIGTIIVIVIISRRIKEKWLDRLLITKLIIIVNYPWFFSRYIKIVNNL